MFRFLGPLMPTEEATIDYMQSQRTNASSRAALQKYATDVYPEKERTLIEYFSDLGLTKQDMQKALFQAYKEKVNDRT